MKQFDIITVKWESLKIIFSHFPILNFDTFPQNNRILTKTLLPKEDHSSGSFFSVCSTKKLPTTMLHEADLCLLLLHLCTSPGAAPSLEFLACFYSTNSSLLICFKSEKNHIQLNSSAYLRIMIGLIFSNLKIQLWQLKLKQVIIFYSWIHVRCLSEPLVPHSVPWNASTFCLFCHWKRCAVFHFFPLVSSNKDSYDMISITWLSTSKNMKNQRRSAANKQRKTHDAPCRKQTRYSSV